MYLLPFLKTRTLKFPFDWYDVLAVGTAEKIMKARTIYVAF